MFLSLVAATHPLRATDPIHSSSGASIAKWSSCTSTFTPSERRRAEMMFFPRFRSRKSVGVSGGGFKLAPYRFFDIRARAFIVLGEIADRLAELVALGDDLGSQSGPRDDRPAT